ncbi:acyltransferase family protein [Lichenifustis flavocetrariae]|uniref:Acyltransferase n=1 Tax=Lichenifustis flavocetrariae TaxID=2949735 RepID=A0AA41YZH8_9HYPH|nr:acyltransferase [Lichenifustis flavocetrariae]MCW6511436.1 acyltransferase [Lichenifustis flavocetrariae]
MDRVVAPGGLGHQPRRLAGLDALRGIAAVAVCLFHWEHIALDTPNSTQFFRFGLLGVELFFLISGFVILMVAERTTSVQDFLSARVVRLYPAYLLSVFLTAIYVLGVGKYDARTVLLNTTMLQSFFDIPNIANPYWTLAFEISFYLAMAVVLACNSLRHIERLALGWLLLAALYRFALPGWMSFDPQRPLVQASYIIVAPQFAPFFVLGMLTYRAYRKQLGWIGAVAIGVALLLTAQGRGDFAEIPGTVYAGFACISVCLLLAASRSVIPGVAFQAIGWLGIISYPLYLVHCTAANLCVVALGGIISKPAAVLISIPLSLSLAAAIHYGVEKPIALTLRRHSRTPFREARLTV